MDIEPIGEYILVEPLEEEATDLGGLKFSTGESKSRPQKGKIIALGQGKILDGKILPFTVLVDQLVLFRKYSGDMVEYNGIDYLLMKENDILAVLKK